MPIWSRDGKQFFYEAPCGGEYWIADIHDGATFSASSPRLLFDTKGFLSAAPSRGWDLSLDGQRFLMVKQGDRKPQPVTELILVQNWFEELKRLVPTGKK